MIGGLGGWLEDLLVWFYWGLEFYLIGVEDMG